MFSAGTAAAVEQTGREDAVGDLWCGQRRRVRLATRLGIHPLICVAGKGVEFVGGLVDKIAEDVVDYRKPSLVEDIRGALQEGQKLMFAPDAVSGKGSCGTSARC
jgi:hypothetical protein